MTSSISRRALATLAVTLGCAGSARAQSLPGPHPSALWVRSSASVSGTLGNVRGRTLSPTTRGFLVGVIIGGVAGGLFGNRVCHAYGSSGSDGCTGDTAWWAVAGGMLGGLLGAAAGSDSDP
jgi:outer membrane lipoprotein SlyB